MNTIEEKKLKKELELEKLTEQKIKIEDKIKKVIEQISNFDEMLNQKAYSEFSTVVDSTGLSMAEILEAIKRGDLNSIQEKINLQKIQKKDDGIE